MQKRVTVTSVAHDIPKERRDGKEYFASVIHYTDGGVDREVSFPTAFLDKNPALRADVRAVQPNTEVELTLEKQGLYWNTTAIKAPGSVPTKTHKTGTNTAAPATKVPFTDNSIGMQVGNALTNASTLLASGAMKGTLESVAVEVLKLGESLKARLTAGEFAAGKSVPVQKTVIEDNLPFGD